MAATAHRRPVVAALKIVAVLASMPLLPAQPAAAMTPVGVTVSVAAGGQNAPTYRIEVRNDTNTGVETTVRQEVPRRATVRSVSDGGQVILDGSSTEVAWDLHLPARSTATLRTTLNPVANPPLAAPACAFVGEGVTAYHCATGVWGLAGEGQTVWWRRPPVLIGLALGLLVLLAAVWWLRKKAPWRRIRRASAKSGADQPGPARLKPVAPQPPAVNPTPRRSPPTWRVVTAAALMLFVTIGLIMWIGVTRVVALEPHAESTRGAWLGTATTGEIGRTLRDSAFEFTVYRLSCGPGEQASQRRCVTMIGLRNVSDASQPWYAGMQRAYLPDGAWVTTDEAATRAANGGHDIFAHPIPAGGQLLAPLVFTVNGTETPAKIELRSAVFSAGVTVLR
ncbi:MAG TPA: hypothetical protein VFX61_08550 [Micromonosporaceae bacterium]|nr:hypothetical protein [Micromonosporaceae bacterium]